MTKEQENEIIENHSLTEYDVVKYAKKFKTHPAIIIGRLQHIKLVPFGLGNNLCKPIDFCS